MTDKEVIKAFECCKKIEEGCSHETCFECPMFEEDVDECTASLFRKVLDLIKRQQTQLRKEENKNKKLRNERNRLKAEIERLKESRISFVKTFPARCNGKQFGMYIALYEAGVQDFAERLTDRISDSIEQSIDNPDGENYFLTDVYNTIEDVKKELTEGSNGID